MAKQERYSPRNRAERVVSAGRFLVAAAMALALVLEADTPYFTPAVISVSFWYLAYAAGIAALTWTRVVTTRGVPLLTHFIDLVVFTAFMQVADGPTSPFFVYFVFAVISGAIRWQARGALLTGAAALAAYAAITLGTRMVVVDADEFRGGQFLARCSHMAIVTLMLAYLGAYQQRLRSEIAGLATWPRRLPTQGPEALQEVLAHASDVLRAPRIILVWTEGDEPSMRVATRIGGKFELTTEPPHAFGTLVAEPLERSSFGCGDASKRRCEVLQRVPGGFRFWRGAPLDERFQKRFQIKGFLALRLSSDTIDGRLFALDVPAFADDELLLGDIVGRLVAGALELQALVEQLREGAAGEERLRLARELHDGILQSLTAASLNVQRARQAVKNNRADAEDRLAKVEETLLTEHQALRRSIAALQPAGSSGMTSVDAVSQVRETATRVGRQWDVRVHLNLQRDIVPLPPRVAHEISRMVQEALVNAIRHGGAREATVTFVAAPEQLLLAVSYDGKGFSSFSGRHDLASLNEMKAGPRTLKERVAALGGTLEIESKETGARVEIGIPVMPAR